MESELLEYIETYSEMVDKFGVLRKDSDRLDLVSKTSKKRMMQMRDLRESHRRTEAKVVSEQLDVV